MDLDALSSMLAGFTGLEPQRREFIEKLPALTESDLTALNQHDSSCPICLTPFLAVLASEEMALAMDSPATSTDDLGVTRLTETCGHVFCRKDITTWIRQHDTCPTCRRPFIFFPTRSSSTTGDAHSTTQSGNDYGLDEEEVLRGMSFPDTEDGRAQRAMILRIMALFQGSPRRNTETPGLERDNLDPNIDMDEESGIPRQEERLNGVGSTVNEREEFVGMYS
ncbi:uncharacterized protein FOMMEDRAFT_169321 [Fomitiporia mediterranea MF3/22]|uniref:uncharacterized protein n=1 Tax=Fomitiporia mediterranea (strain MF3/22) TaxID=694068 RepID=UPI0004407FED|nr:uncharacterized protein FOMMEDRAFT_169321 [Fomitiporia mediterranea MF3/22]EJD01147.1 hypothetical protein FOMMEDRAFT_169321 [Fomitiporia mediterranea MF3/22]